MYKKKRRLQNLENQITKVPISTGSEIEYCYSLHYHCPYFILRNCNKYISADFRSTIVCYILSLFHFFAAEYLHVPL